jgi:hypothetical protein
MLAPSLSHSQPAAIGDFEGRDFHFRIFFFLFAPSQSQPAEISDFEAGDTGNTGDTQATSASRQLSSRADSTR